MKTFFGLIGIILAILCQFSCSPDVEKPQLENPITDDLTTGFSAAPPLGDVVLENMYEEEARKLTDKTPVQIVTVLEGTHRVVLQARFRGIRDMGFGFPLYECELMDESAEAMGGIAGGMSGSPVGPPGRIMGALAYSEDFARTPTRFWVTAIDAMEAAIDHQTLGELLEQEPVPAAPNVGIHATYMPVKTPMMVTGIQAHRFQELSSYLTASRYNSVELFAGIGGAPGAPPAARSAKLAPGDMIGVASVEGDIVNLTGFGTVTQVYDDTFVAFGHSLFGDGKAALPVYRAVVNGLVPNLIASNKSVSAYGTPIGTITKDLTPGIVGEFGPPPPMIPVKVTYHPANRPTAIEKHHRVAYGQERLIAATVAGTVDAIRMEISSGTVAGSVTLQFQETDTVYTQSFRQVSPSVFSDILQNVSQIVQTFSDTLMNSAGKATLKAVSIAVTDKPQIAKAEILEVIAPEEIIPGESVPVSIVLVPHWSTAGAERTIQREITLEVPEDFPAGEANINVSVGALDAFTPGGEFRPPLDADLGFGFGGFGDEEEKPVPQNLDELIQQLEEDQVDPGLITVRLTPSGFGEDFEGPPAIGEMPDGVPPLDEFPLPDDLEPPPTVEAELTLDGFVVTGSRDTTVLIRGEDIEDDRVPAPEHPIEPVEPGEEE